jgi:hypothetical protein
VVLTSVSCELQDNCIFYLYTIMKALYSAIIALAIVGCQKSEHAHHNEGNATESDSTNTILYNQVMDIHDEVMPKMEDLYNLKKDLQAKLAAAPADAKQGIELKIAEIDSASTMMEDWMHEFNPPADTTDKEQIRSYLEGEMVKVKRVKEAMIHALSTDEKN